MAEPRESEAMPEEDEPPIDWPEPTRRSCDESREDPDPSPQPMPLPGLDDR